METKATNTLVRHKTDGTTYTQTTYTGKLRWKERGYGSVKLVLQQEEITNFIENHVISKQEVKWVDVPVEWIKD